MVGDTYREIHQQPELWPTTLDIVGNSGWADERFDGPVIVTGAGTSAYAASAIAAAWPNAQGAPATDLLIESGQELKTRFPEAGWLISVGRSGDSPESVAVVNRIRRYCPYVSHLAITCNANGQLANTAGIHAIVLDPRTNDRGLAMTSSFSNLVLAGLALRRRAELTNVLPAICARAQELLPAFDEQAKRLASEASERVVLLGGGAFRPLAAEASLKILEMTAGRTSTIAETFLGLRHGPMSFVTPATLVLCFLSALIERRRYERDLIRELRQKGLGFIVGIAPDGEDTELLNVRIPAVAGETEDRLRVPFEIVFAQLLAFHMSLKQGLDPDNPSPRGAITRVVQKFVIHDEAPDV